MRRTTATTCGRFTIGFVLAGVVLGVLGVGGCRQAPITEKDERSQFDRYDAVRDSYAPAYLEDEYGRKKPNLRGRLIGRR